MKSPTENSDLATDVVSGAGPAGSFSPVNGNYVGLNGMKKDGLHVGSEDVGSVAGNRPSPVQLGSVEQFPPLSSIKFDSSSKGPSMIENVSCIQKLQNETKRKGSGFFDVSKNMFGPRESPKVETKNAFGSLQDDEDCFDTEQGLWEKEMLLVRKFYETNTQPPNDVFKSWSEKQRAYYVMLTKFDPVNEAMIETKNEDEIEVESETDESARDIVRGV
ncbi:hypothetical protein Hanom_Chr16g01455511 [Helianthus anomalus]